MTQKIYSGYGSYQKLTEILNDYSPKKIFLVTGKKSFSSSTAEKLIGEILTRFNYDRFSEFENNVKHKDLKRGIKIFLSGRFDFILAVGGGSVIDMAKAISILATQENKPEEYIRGTDKASARQISTIIIPTTAGTGSESTRFSVVYIDKVKYSLAHDSLLPDYAILDPTFTLELPPYITACAAFDALSQAIESFWSTQSNEKSLALSKKAIGLAVDNIVKVVTNPDKDSREKMLQASNLAGQAINIAYTTAAHAVSYPFTSFFNIPHGHAVALTLPRFLELNFNVNGGNLQDRRGIGFVKDRINELIELLGQSGIDGTVEYLEKLIDVIGLKRKLSDLGITEKDFDSIIAGGFNPLRMKNNPVAVTRENLREILNKMK